MKVFTGSVVHTKMHKTATVVVERVYKHPVYKKRIKRLRKYHVHDEIGVEPGQTVKFAASKPYSKLKKWKIIEVVTEKKVAKGASGKRKVSKRTKRTERKK